MHELKISFSPEIEWDMQSLCAFPSVAEHKRAALINISHIWHWSMTWSKRMLWKLVLLFSCDDYSLLLNEGCVLSFMWMAFSVPLHTFSDCHFKDVYIKFRKYNVKYGLFPPENSDFCIIHSCCIGSFFKQFSYFEDYNGNVHCFWSGCAFKWSQ